MRILDTRGFSCPQPVVMTKKAMKEEQDLDILVSSRSALENVTRFAEAMGAKVTQKQEGDGWRIEVRR